ncbi:MAG: radical SAM protein [Candidatus Heimdallarchaeota archaeon]|nr:radical SAM protein [Candidatus Heimdallarchaeota archaeon]
MKLMSQSPLHEAEYYDVLDEENKVILCRLCPIECTLLVGEIGKCSSRINLEGKMYSLTYGYTDMKIDMIEKQHVFHFHPNSRAQTFSTYNCNLDCDYCVMPDKIGVDPAQTSAKKLAPDQAAMFGMASGSKVMAFGEAEPLISFEWVRDTAILAQQRNLKVLLRTNAYFNEEPVKEILEYVDAVIIDIKSVTDTGYQQKCHAGTFKEIKKIIKLIYEEEKLLELNFVIHGALENTEGQTRELAEWIKEELSVSVPLHLDRLLPAHRLKEVQPTTTELLEKCYQIAKDVGLEFVYLNNVPDHEASHTYCPKCGELLIYRGASATEVRRISLQGNCNKCETKLNIVFK